jgi:hypothetical protein
VQLILLNHNVWYRTRAAVFCQISMRVTNRTAAVLYR